MDKVPLRQGFSAYHLSSISIIPLVLVTRGHPVARLVEALRYKPEGRGFVGIFHCYKPSGRTKSWGGFSL